MDTFLNGLNRCYLSSNQGGSSTSAHNVSKANVQKLLELLNTTEDKGTHVKIFTILTTQIILNNDSSDMIITCNCIYIKILSLISKSQPIRTAKILYFITALLYMEEDEVFTKKKSLVIFAQNMIRNSGCLLAMCNLFTGSMMHQETWRALCRCLAEVCENSYENQTFCRHLVPLSIEKCIQGDTEVILTLKNLITNHNRNTQLFLECNGLTIFNKELLRYDSSLQLLDSLVQTLSTEPLSALSRIVYEHLKYFKSECPDRKVGQWATLILYHINFRLKGLNETEKYLKETINTTENEKSGIRQEKPDSEETANLLQNVLREIYLNAKNTKLNSPITMQRVANIRGQGSCRDKSVLSGIQRNISSRIKVKNDCRKQTHGLKKRESSIDMSFSFLLKPPSYHDDNNSMLISPQRPENIINKYTSPYESGVSKNKTFISYMSKQKIYKIPDKSNTSRCNDLNINNFKPNFASTPNQSKYFENHTTNLSKLSRLSRLSHKTFKRVHLTTKNIKDDSRCKKVMEKFKQNSIQHRSMSTRFFDAINESCTTIVKTVKNILRPKKVADEIAHEQTSLSSGNKVSCSYSFTDYMRKRDAILSDKLNNKSIESETKNLEFCKTCNDTIILKRKLDSDDFFKETIKKLKLGINLYGCDFKKISRTMWPRESYMTPQVLYNLYRRLILK